MESNDSPEIPDRGETSDIPGIPSGGEREKVLSFKSVRILHPRIFGGKKGAREGYKEHVLVVIITNIDVAIIH